MYKGIVCPESIVGHGTEGRECVVGTHGIDLVLHILCSVCDAWSEATQPRPTERARHWSAPRSGKAHCIYMFWHRPPSTHTHTDPEHTMKWTCSIGEATRMDNLPQSIWLIKSLSNRVVLQCFQVWKVTMPFNGAFKSRAIHSTSCNRFDIFWSPKCNMHRRDQWAYSSITCPVQAVQV